MNYEMERMNGSFVSDVSGITTPAPYVTLIKDRSAFSHFLSDRTLFFDGRFAFYNKYESKEYYEEHDLIAVIVRGEHELKSLEKVGDIWEVSLTHMSGDGHAMYFITAPKEQEITGAEIV